MEDAAGSPGLAPLAISLCLTEMDTTWTSTKRPEGKGPRPPFPFLLSPSSPLYIMIGIFRSGWRRDVFCFNRLLCVWNLKKNNAFACTISPFSHHRYNSLSFSVFVFQRIPGTALSQTLKLSWRALSSSSNYICARPLLNAGGIIRSRIQQVS